MKTSIEISFPMTKVVCLVPHKPPLMSKRENDREKGVIGDKEREKKPVKYYEHALNNNCLKEMQI